MPTRAYLDSLRAESDDELSEHRSDILYDRETRIYDDFDRARLAAIRAEMIRRNDANPNNPPFPGLIR